MDILLRKKKLYDVENKDENIESHYREYLLSFSLSRPFISIIIVDTAEIVCYVDLFTIHNLFNKIKKALKILKCPCGWESFKSFNHGQFFHLLKHLWIGHHWNWLELFVNKI